MAEQLSSLDVAAQTDVGLKRKRNEDFCEYYIPTPNAPQHAHGALFVVADGMGGMGGGDVASQAAVKTLFDQYYTSEYLPGSTSISLLKQALDAANAAVREKARQINLPRIGSTAAGVLLVPGGEAVIFNVGDARVYRIRQHFIEQLSHDQSVLQHQLDAGVITEEQARQSRNVNVTAFIGQENPLEAVYRRVQIEPDDIFLLCSDGLWDLVEAHEMLNIIEQYPAEVAARRLIELARKRGAHDNVTVIVLRIGNKPRQAIKWWQIALAAVIALVIAAVLWFAFLREDDNATKTSNTGLTPTTAGIAEVTTLPTTGPPETTASGSTASTAAGTEATTSASSAVIIYTPTPSHTPTSTPTLDITDTLTPTATAIPSATPTRTVTLTRTATLTATPVPSATPSHTPPPSPTASSTPPPSPTASITSTPPPSETATPRPPTATLNPDVISPTPSPLPSPTPTMSPAEIRLYFAALDGIELAAPATLYVLYQLADSDEVTVLEERPLAAGTQLRVLATDAQPHPDQPDLLLREVEILDTLDSVTQGWIDAAIIEDALPLVPYAVAQEVGANLRKGDSTAYEVIGALAPGEMARIVGKSMRAAGWYRVETLSGTQGWVSAAAADIVGDTSSVPNAAAPPLPTATPTPETGEDSRSDPFTTPPDDNAPAVSTASATP